MSLTNDSSLSSYSSISKNFSNISSTNYSSKQYSSNSLSKNTMNKISFISHQQIVHHTLQLYFYTSFFRHFIQYFSRNPENPAVFYPAIQLIIHSINYQQYIQEKTSIIGWIFPPISLEKFLVEISEKKTLWQFWRKFHTGISQKFMIIHWKSLAV